MFLPVTKEEMKKLGWDQLDVILVSGDAYIDSPYDGIALIGKTLLNEGYKVGVISQPRLDTVEDISRLGVPRLFWGVSSGIVDSMVANYTALGKKKRSDDSTPGGMNNLRPDRAVIRYTNLIREHFKDTAPIVLGGIEASLRRIAHYDFWSDKLRGSVLLDSKADILAYGMGERTIIEIAKSFENKSDITKLKGICYPAPEPPEDARIIPSFEEVKADKDKFIEMFHIFYQNNDPLNAETLAQKHGGRWLIQNPPNFYLEQEELDKIHELDFEYDAHPYYKRQGEIKALNTIKFSVNTHRGCYGECNFCAISVHQGRRIRSRSKESVLREVEKFTKMKNFKGNIYDLGGPTANMYHNICKKMSKKGACKDKRCLSPERCKVMQIDHENLVNMMKDARKIPGVKKIFIGSGLRYDLVVADEKSGGKYLREIASHHVSGQLKIAPEHTSDKVLNLMGKPDNESLVKFKNDFMKASKQAGKKQFLTYYFIAAHPGCELRHMEELKSFASKELNLNPEQVQVFTPTPSTYSTLMYYTGKDPFTGEKIYVERGLKGKRQQKEILTERKKQRYKKRKKQWKR